MSIDSAAVLAAFKMPPAEAVAFLQSKGLQVTNSWRELHKEAHRRAFTVARSAGYDVLEDIRQALVDAMSKGDSYKKFIDDLKPTLQAKGWWGKAIDKETGEIVQQYEGTSRAVELGSPYRLKLIYEQNLQTALMAGRYKEMSAATDTHPYWQYVAILDTRTRPSHRAMHGRIFKYDDPVWSVAYPPNGWRCRCRVRPMSAAALDRSKLTVTSGKGAIQEVSVPQRDGTAIQVKRINLPGMDKPFQPDARWDYNPAADFGNVSKPKK
jgi:SPP1 gp7 family putative phage head morphogenesis protein